MLRRFFTSLFDSLTVPRASERRIRELSLDDLQYLARHKSEPQYAPEIRVLLPYKDTTVRSLILEMKYHRNPHALQLLRTLLFEELLALSEEWLAQVLLIPVPMHAARRKARGYNQTELLCEPRIDPRPIPRICYVPHGLRRTRGGAAQQTLARAVRLANMGGSMEASPMVLGRLCLVIDDVTTTGATLRECRRALKAGGARSVHLLALAG